jgi:Transposase IS66 family
MCSVKGECQEKTSLPPVSAGTLATLLKGCAGELAGAELVIKEGLRQAAVLGVDETGLRISKRQDWVHVSSTEGQVKKLYGPLQRRGVAST